jgi:acyl-CoA synthetase (NDP forming)
MTPDDGSAFPDAGERTASLRPFFHPRSVAVGGASRDPASIGYRLIESLQGSRFAGTIIPVNPHAAEIAGLRAAPSLRDIPGGIDLAVIAVPADVVLGIVDECAAKKIPAVVLITAGFAETGAGGGSLEARLREKVRRHGIRLIGPNCFGLMNTDPSVRLNATYTPAFPPPGRVAIASESGGLGIAIVTAARRLNLGVSAFVSIGNHADVSVNDLLEYWEQDQATGVIALYLETIVEPGRFRRIAERVGRRKPIVALKAGRTRTGQRAAGSHTAAIANDNAAVDALFCQCGIIRAETLDELLALASGLSNQPLPAGRRVGILTNSGGPGVLCADRCAAEGLIVPELSAETISTLASFLPPMAALGNPVDVIGFATQEQHARAVETLLTADVVDALIVVHVSVRAKDNGPVAAGIEQGIRNARRAIGREKPVYICWMAEGDRDRIFSIDGETIPAYPLPEMAARVLSRAAAHETWRRLPAGQAPDHPDVDLTTARALCGKALSVRGPGWLAADETRGVLSAMRLPIPPGGVATTAERAVALAGNIGYPVAAKLASRRLVHKSDVGGVRLNLMDERQVRQAFEEIRERMKKDGTLDDMDGVLVQPMIAQGIETMIGATRDPLFGPLIAFGLGGIHVEVLGDVRFRLAPLTDRDATELVKGIKGYRLLEGHRGRPPADLRALENVLLRISRLVESVPEVTELDLNPVFALPEGQGCLVADARVKVG